MFPRLIIGLVLGAFLMSSCSDFNKLQKDGSFDEKLEGAVKYYDEKDYYRAALLFEDLLPLIIGKKDAEKVQMYYAYTQYKQEAYYLSSYYFKKFYTSYPRHDRVEEARYMYAMSLYNEAPKYNLDQLSTYQAIDAFQKFVNSYPETEYLQKCNERIREMQDKLELKDYENTKLYHKIGSYKAAVLAIANYRADWPDSDNNEELAFLKIDAQYNLAKNSLETVMKDGVKIELQKDRYRAVLKFYQEFVDKYSGSKYLKEAETLYGSAEEKLNENS